MGMARPAAIGYKRRMPPVRALIVVGTRPEAVKLAPVVLACQGRASDVEPRLCLTGQHRELLQPVLRHFGLAADDDLEVMQPGQSLAALSARCLERLDERVARHAPDCLVAQGDTTSVWAAAMVAYYRRLPLVHVEAGLRTGDLYAPWPEELYRRLAGLLAAVHAAPTEGAARNLLREGLPPQRVHVTGNTAIDALRWTLDEGRARRPDWWTAAFDERPLVLVTVHRRESFGAALDGVCRAIDRLSAAWPEHLFVWPVHVNPVVQATVGRQLGALGRENLRLVEPVEYPAFVWLLAKCQLVLTDSGGLVEEAPTLGKPVMILRAKTERPEAVECGAAEIVGTDPERIVARAEHWLADAAASAAVARIANPFGDGRAAGRIVELIARRAWD